MQASADRQRGHVRECVTRRIFSGRQFRIAGRSTTLLDALACLESSAIDMVLLSHEFREEELSLFTFDAHRRGYAGLILHVTSIASDMTRATLARSRGFSDGQFVPQSLDGGSQERTQSRSSEWHRLSSQRVTPDVRTRMELNDPHGTISFTAKQQTVLTRVSEGWTNQQIALHLKCSEGSVKAVLQELFSKLGVRKRAQIVRMAFEKTPWNPGSGSIRPRTTQRGHRKRASSGGPKGSRISVS